MKANPPRRATRSRWLSAGIVLAPVLMTIGGCVPPSQPPPAAPPPARPRVVVPASRLPADWRDAPATVGDWTWVAEEGRSTARFADGLLILRCDQPGRVALIRGGSTPAPAALTITTTSLARTLAATPLAGLAPAFGASLTPGDQLLDAMAFSRGRFMVTAPATAPLYVPSWPEIGRVIEDCR